VRVVSKSTLFRAPGGKYDISIFEEEDRNCPHPIPFHALCETCGKDKNRSSQVMTTNKLEGAILVIHNNSDGFGQNIETENAFGSLDGAIGANSSAAASLRRDRKDLLDFVF
jgi:hypothetical protein